MADDTVGYGKPPLATRFRKGVCPNPLGRGARKEGALAKAVETFLKAEVSLREGGKAKRAMRAELSVRRLVASALGGNVKDARRLLRLRKQAPYDDDGRQVITIHGGLPEGHDVQRVNQGANTYCLIRGYSRDPGLLASP